MDFGSPYPRSISVRKSVSQSLTYGTIVGLFLIVLRPFDLDQLSFKPLLRIGIIYGALTTSVILGSHLFFKRFLFKKWFAKWTLRHEFTYHFFVLVLIGFANAIFSYLDKTDAPFLPLLGKLLFNTISIGLVLITILTLFIRKRYLEQHIRTLENNHLTPPTVPNKIQSDYPQDLLLKDLKGNTAKVAVENIIYFESADHYLKIYTTEGFFLLRQSLQKTLQELDQQQFIQTHRSIIVNREHTQGLSADGSQLKLSNNIEVRVSRRNRPLVKAWLNQ